ncbi:MAG TPA: hypothetical protein VGT61_07035 [Thermomicrobiales bacterium]|jgi:hypothetical protein|nr:hypothetical protein [Thermomicrobiales bacterium]
MSASDVYEVTIVFDHGARASIRTHELPAIPDTIWEPGSLCWIGDHDGPQLEIEGGHVVSMAVRRQGTADGPLTKTSITST